MTQTHIKVPDVAALLGVTESTVRRWITRGLLPAQRAGTRGHWMIRREDVQALGESS